MSGRRIQTKLEIFISHILVTHRRRECWEWRSSTYPNGYGMFNNDGRTESAHRASYRFFYGEIPEGLCVCHYCDNKLCVRPSHLFLGTQKDNVDDMISKGRRWSYSRLSDNDVREIRGSKAASRQLSQRFRVSESYIYLIRRGKRRQSVE